MIITSQLNCLNTNKNTIIFVCIAQAITITYYCTPSFLLYLDIDECPDNVCGDNGDCSNNPGSYACDCHTGFELVPDETPPCIGLCSGTKE